MDFRACTILLVFAALSCNAIAQPSVEMADVPDWAEQLTIVEYGEDRAAEFQFGIAYLLSDRQIRKTNLGYEYFERLAYRIIDRSGLESSATITRSFDPESESLSFNFVRVLRDGEVVDRLTDAEITVLRQEEGLSSNILNGDLTALIQLEGVQVGDVIDYAVSGSVESRLWPDEIFEAASVEWSVPLAQLHYRLMVPETFDLNVRRLSTQVEPAIRIENGWKSYTINVFDEDPVPIEIYVATNWITHGFIMFSSMDSWAEVVDWGIPLFSFDEPLAEEFAAKLDAIASEYDSPGERAVQALRLVQSDIRYLGLEVGLGSHVPRSPAITLELGYGDCKDKAVLLVSALNYLGISAAPALASISNGNLLSQFPATIGAFDHVIVEIDLGNEKIWVDPTLSHQGGNAETLVSPDYGHVLPIRRGQSQLIALERPFSDQPTLEIIETFRFPQSGQSGLSVSVEEVYRSWMADAIRIDLSNFGRESYERNFLDYYAANYNVTGESQPLVASDDLEANVIRLTSQYEVDESSFLTNDLSNTLPVFATAVQDILPRQVEAQRTASLWLPYGVNARHTVRISTPGRQFPLPPDVSESAGGVTYRQQFRQEGDVLEIDYSLTVTERTAEVAAIEPVTDIADQIALNSVLHINMQSAIPGMSQRLGLSEPLNPETEAAILSIANLIEQQDFVGALTELNSLLTEHTEENEIRGVLQLMRGVSLAYLGRNAAAKTTFEEAFSLYEPTDSQSYLLYTNVLSREAQFDEASSLIVRMIEKNPKFLNVSNLEWALEYSRFLYRVQARPAANMLVLVLAKTLSEYVPDGLEDYEWVFSQAVTFLVWKEDYSEATEYLTYMTDPREFLRLQSDRDYLEIWDAVADRAGDGLSTVIEEHVSVTRDAAEQRPDSFQRATAYVGALRMAGRPQEALDYAKPIVDDWARIEAVGEEAFWFINEYAYALSEAGHADEAHRLMTRLLEIGIAENSQLVSMAINRAAMLMHWEEFEAALEAVSELESLGDGFASDFGRMWIYHVKACSLYEVDRVEDAEAVLQELILPLASTNPTAHTVTLLCLHQREQAAATVIDRLAGESTKTRAISSFADPMVPAFVPPFLDELRTRAVQVRAMPDVQSALEDVGRAISINASSGYWGDHF